MTSGRLECDRMWSVNCGRCRRTGLERATAIDLERNLDEAGWVKLLSLWTCPECLQELSEIRTTATESEVRSGGRSQPGPSQPPSVS